MFNSFKFTSNVLQKYSKKTFAVNEKALKNRIKSVSSIAKITKAMKMVSTSKMRADIARLNAGKDFGHDSIEKMFKSDTYMQKKMETAGSANKVLIVPFTSDKGLCGGINSSIIREVKVMVNSSPNKNQIGLFVIGDKGSFGLSRPFPELLKKSTHDMMVPINYSTASALSHHIAIMGDDYDKIILVYNVYKSAISNILTKTELIPRNKFLDYFSYGKKYLMAQPDKSTANPALYDLYLASNVYYALLNSVASEQSARMNAMENASKNAREIVQKLVLVYNKARQARITMELVEIISGASAV